MKKIIVLFFIFLSTSSVFAQMPKQVIVNHEAVTLYKVSLSDLGYPKNILATTYGDIIRTAMAQGYKLCSPQTATKLYEVYSDGLTGRDWSSFEWLTICTTFGTYRIGKNEEGKFMDLSDEKTWCVSLNTSHKFLVFTK